MEKKDIVVPMRGPLLKFVTSVYPLSSMNDKNHYFNFMDINNLLKQFDEFFKAQFENSSWPDITNKTKNFVTTAYNLGKAKMRSEVLDHMPKIKEIPYPVNGLFENNSDIFYKNIGYDDALSDWRNNIEKL